MGRVKGEACPELGGTVRVSVRVRVRRAQSWVAKLEQHVDWQPKAEELESVPAAELVPHGALGANRGLCHETPRDDGGVREEPGTLPART